MRAMPDHEPSCACKAEAALREIVDEPPVRDPFGTLSTSDPYMLGARAEQSRQKKRARAALGGNGEASHA